MEDLKTIKTCLIAQVQAQMGDLKNVDAKELGEVIDMIKDIEEAIYYCTITEAMKENSKEPAEESRYYSQPTYYRDMDRDMGRMYYSDNGSGSSKSSSSGGNNGSSSGMRSYSERDYEVPMRDRREGRSPMSRKTYMEAKELHQDKGVQIKELEKYMSELTNDITEMIKDATPEEKQVLQSRIATLANKIGQL